ncbi:hypothetical protein J2Y45_001204 [Dyadobacter sp. BE34]|uniref:Uncharacterized protein n=1 Tax=Dyadobacter fermentans TaxID=94254 RepID=A0ABU1QUG2_9BACT|nr:hypothetical protein [Dyadobacter fermentans]MDR7041675.1 hypothetical protein [Dyadobacter sp. BE242]MDR7196078.1 hypothetical protein [Dyadobacter sp. BE34]MDR7213377.1 hypothetical protein [Dyadobacter sp. BE31]MDR7261484.1 hypothetical protein [Dyadobacter sp. BE32]
MGDFYMFEGEYQTHYKSFNVWMKGAIHLRSALTG